MDGGSTLPSGAAQPDLPPPVEASERSKLDQRPANPAHRRKNSSTLPSPRRSAQLIRATRCLWGKNLTAFLDEIYRKRAKFCVVFVSEEYKERKWTIHELRSAQAKALEQKGEEYILPVKVDDTELDGLPPNVGYVAISLGIEKIAELLIKKLQG